MLKFLIVAIMAIYEYGVLGAGVLTINSNQSDPVPKAAFQKIIKKFESENPTVKVNYNIFNHEAYKTALRNWLTTSPPDVIHWFAGNRMKQFVSRSLLEDVSDLWQQDKLHQHMASSLGSMTVDGRQWGVPFTYYQWGIYYRKDVFKKLGLQEPQTWQQFLELCAAIKKSGITPITIGTKYLWTAAGWFDYLNLRLNGLDFHQDLMDGKVAYTHQRVRQVFSHWQQLIEPGYFLANHASYSWQEAFPFFLKGQSAMYLLGNFISQNFGNQEADFGFFQFPRIDPRVPLVEEAPLDTLHIPAKAKNKADARKFLRFMARQDVQEEINLAIGQLPPHQQAKSSDNYFLKIGGAMLKQSAGTSQFYDRDTPAEMAKVGMRGFQEFMVKPQRLDKILSQLERHRQRVFGGRS